MKSAPPTVTWLGQGGYLFESGGTRLAIDPYLSDSLAPRGFTRLFPPPITAEALCPDFVFCTHDHGDHLDPETIKEIAGQHPTTQFCGPSSVQGHLGKLGIAADRILPIDTTSQIQLGGLSLTATPAWHSDPDAVGAILRVEDLVIYLTADTILHPDLIPQVQTRLDRAPDLLLTCINGRLGNMGAADAVTLAKALKPRLSIPMHYGMFVENTADPEEFVNGCNGAGLVARTLEVAKRYQLSELFA